EIAKLREDMNRLREDMILGFKRHDEEIAKLREDMNRLREDMILGFKRHDEEIAKLREDMNRLREDMILGFKRHDEEIAKLREDMNRLREDMMEGFRLFDKRIVSLEGVYFSLERKVGSLERAMVSGFGEISKFAGLTFEEFVRKFLTERLRGSGEIAKDAELVKAVVDGEEINMFLEDPLIVGEVTAYADSVDEMLKLLRKAEKVKAKYSKEPRKILVILSAKNEAAREMGKIAKEKNVELVIGKTLD
ncbi:MAG: hypothetical protein ACKD6M_02315, partial [Candidatus Bathyarchaeota archaeon]